RGRGAPSVMPPSRVGNAESGVAAKFVRVFTCHKVSEGRAWNAPDPPDGAANRRRDHRYRCQDDRRADLEQDLPGLARLQCHGRPRPGSDDPGLHSLQRTLWPGDAASSKSTRHPDHPKITMLGVNKFDDEGRLRDEIYRRGAEGWHTDGAYNQAPFKATQLY